MVDHVRIKRYESLDFYVQDDDIPEEMRTATGKMYDHILLLTRFDMKQDTVKPHIIADPDNYYKKIKEWFALVKSDFMRFKRIAIPHLSQAVPRLSPCVFQIEKDMYQQIGRISYDLYSFIIPYWKSKEGTIYEYLSQRPLTFSDLNVRKRKKDYTVAVDEEKVTSTTVDKDEDTCCSSSSEKTTGESGSTKEQEDLNEIETKVNVKEEESKEEELGETREETEGSVGVDEDETNNAKENQDKDTRSKKMIKTIRGA